MHLLWMFCLTDKMIWDWLCVWLIGKEKRNTNFRHPLLGIMFASNIDLYQLNSVCWGRIVGGWLSKHFFIQSFRQKTVFLNRSWQWYLIHVFFPDGHAFCSIFSGETSRCMTADSFLSHFSVYPYSYFLWTFPLAFIGWKQCIPALLLPSFTKLIVFGYDK